MADDWLSYISMRPDGTAYIAFNRLSHDEAMEHLRLFADHALEDRRRNKAINPVWPAGPAKGTPA